MNRSRKLTHISQRAKQTNRRKTVSQFNGFVTIPQTQMQKQYSTLAKESIDKDFELSGLKPFSHKNVTQIESQLSDLKIAIPQKNFLFGKKDSIREKMDTIICKVKTRRYNQKRKEPLIKSLLQNDQAALIEDYTEELNYDKQNQGQVIRSINKKLVKYFPDQIDTKEFNAKSKNKIIRFKKQKNVSMSYQDQQGEDFLYQRSISREMQRQHTKKGHKRKKVINFENLSKKYNSARQIPRSGKYSKVYFKSYLCSYEDRKNFLSLLSK